MGRTFTASGMWLEPMELRHSHAELSRQRDGQWYRVRVAAKDWERLGRRHGRRSGRRIIKRMRELRARKVAIEHRRRLAWLKAKLNSEEVRMYYQPQPTAKDIATELRSFTEAKHDDYVDAATYAFGHIVARPDPLEYITINIEMGKLEGGKKP
jgi:hypothetical protein